MAKTTCPDEYGLNYTLPMFHKCEMKRIHDGSMVQSIPKLIPSPSVIGGCHRRKSKEGIPGGHRICRIPYCVKNLCNNGWCEETMVGYNCTCSSGFQGRHCDEKSTELSTTDATSKPTTSPTTTMSDTTTSQDTTTSTCSSPPVDCEYGGSFYNFSTSRMNHASAVLACSQYGSHLVFIESEEEQDFIEGGANEDYWIGLTGSSLSEARWLDGSSLTYSKFESKSFNENVNCFRIWFDISRPDWHRYSWHDRDCSTQFRYICEKEVGM